MSKYKILFYQNFKEAIYHFKQREATVYGVYDNIQAKHSHVSHKVLSCDIPH
jgi:hypothetical protein